MWIIIALVIAALALMGVGVLVVEMWSIFPTHFRIIRKHKDYYAQYTKLRFMGWYTISDVERRRQSLKFVDIHPPIACSSEDEAKQLINMFDRKYNKLGKNFEVIWESSSKERALEGKQNSKQKKPTMSLVDFIDRVRSYPTIGLPVIVTQQAREAYASLAETQPGEILFAEVAFGVSHDVVLVELYDNGRFGKLKFAVELSHDVNVLDVFEFPPTEETK